LAKKFKAINETTSKRRWIKNISRKELSNDEKSVLEKGLNFALSPKTIPVLEIAAFVVKGLKNICNKPVGEIEMARSRIAQVVHNSRPSTPNVSPQEINALNNLKSDNSIIILKAEKGNIIVVMDKYDYDSKILQLINDTNTCRKIKMKPNPITAIENDVNKFFWRLAKENKY